MRHVAERDGAADDPGVAAEAPQPCAVAEERNARTLRRVLTGKEVAAECRGHAERAEETRGDARGGHGLGAGRPGHEVRSARVELERFDGARHALPVEIVGERQGRARAQLAGRLGDADEPRRVAVGKGLDECRVDEGEERGAGADAKAQDADGREREAGVPGELAQREAHILRRVLDDRYPGLVAIRLLRGFHTAKLHQRGAARLVGTEASAQVGVDLVLHVALELIGKLPFAACPSQQAERACQQASQGAHAFSPEGVRNRARIAFACSQLLSSRLSCRRPARVIL